MTGRSRELLEGAMCLVHGVGPRTVELQDLGAMYQTLSAVRHEVRMSVTPTAERGRPFLRAAEIERQLAHLDHRAVDEPGDDRRHFVGGHRHHGLVERGNTFGLRAAEDERLATAEPAERCHVHVAEAVADRGGVAELLQRGGVVASEQMSECDGYQQETAFDAIVVAVVQDTLSAGQPAARRGHLAAQQEIESDPEHAARRARRISGAE